MVLILTDKLTTISKDWWWSDRDIKILKISLPLNNRWPFKSMVWSLQTAVFESLRSRYCKQGITGNSDIHFVNYPNRTAQYICSKSYKNKATAKSISESEYHLQNTSLAARDHCCSQTWRPGGKVSPGCLGWHEAFHRIWIVNVQKEDVFGASRFPNFLCICLIYFPCLSLSQSSLLGPLKQPGSTLVPKVTVTESACTNSPYFSPLLPYGEAYS